MKNEPLAGLVEKGREGILFFLFHADETGTGVPAVVAAGEEADFYLGLAGGQGVEVEIHGVGHFGCIVNLVSKFAVHIDAEILGVHAPVLGLFQGEGVGTRSFDVVGDIDAPFFVVPTT